MDPDAKVQVATMGTKLEFSTDSTDGKTGTWTRVYGLASTPDFGGQPNTIDTTTLDNTKAETSVLGLQPAAEVTYEINMMTFADVPKDGTVHNLRAVKAMAVDKVKAHWIVVKASGVIIEYDATTTISYTADAQQDIEKFSIYHDVKSDIVVSLPSDSSI